MKPEEPFFIAQTFEPEHIKNLETQDAWIRSRRDESKAKGATHARFSWVDEPRGFLFEAWKTRPESEGDPRWSLGVTP